MPFMPSSAMASASRNSVLRPPLPLPLSVMVVSPPEISTQGGFSGWPRSLHCRAMPAWTSATSRDSPSIESPRITGVTPALRATSAAASSEACGVAIMMFSTRAKQGSPGFGVSSTGLEHAAHTRRHVNLVFGDDGEGVLVGRRIGNGRARGDDGRIIAGHVRDHQRHDMGGKGGPGEAAALDGRETFAHRVHLGDGGARFEQRLVDRLLVFEREAFGGEGEQAPSRRRR